MMLFALGFKVHYSLYELPLVLFRHLELSSLLFGPILLFFSFKPLIFLLVPVLLLCFALQPPSPCRSLLVSFDFIGFVGVYMAVQIILQPLLCFAKL